MSMYAIGEKRVQSVTTDQVIENWVVFVNGAGIKGTIFFYDPSFAVGTSKFTWLAKTEDASFNMSGATTKKKFDGACTVTIEREDCTTKLEIINHVYDIESKCRAHGRVQRNVYKLGGVREEYHEKWKNGKLLDPGTNNSSSTGGKCPVHLGAVYKLRSIGNAHGTAQIHLVGDGTRMKRN